MTMLQVVVDFILNTPRTTQCTSTGQCVICKGSGAFNWSSVAEAIAVFPTSINLVDLCVMAPSHQSPVRIPVGLRSATKQTYP